MKCALLHFRQGIENWRSYLAAVRLFSICFQACELCQIVVVPNNLLGG